MILIDSEKDALIIALEAKCYDHNFGTLNKADFELLMFHHYMESLRKIDAVSNDASKTAHKGIVQTALRIPDSRMKKEKCQPAQGSADGVFLLEK